MSALALVGAVGTCQSNLGSFDASSAKTSLRGVLDCCAVMLEALAAAGAEAVGVEAEKLNPPEGAAAVVVAGFCCAGAAEAGVNENPVEAAGAGADTAGADAGAGVDADTAGFENEKPPEGAAGVAALGLGALNENPDEGALAALLAAGLPKLKLG